MDTNPVQKKTTARKWAVGLIAALVLVIVAGVWFVSANSTPADDATSTEQPEYVEPYIYLNKETGQITKITDEFGATTFEQGYTSSDTKNYFDGDREGSIDLEQTLAAEGKSYPVSATLRWTATPGDRDELIAYYNEHIAAPRTNQPPSFSIYGAITSHITSQVNAAHSTNQMPAVNIALNGKVDRNVDSRVAEAWRSQVSAAQVYETLYGSTSGPIATHYRFNCATYGVSLVNGNEILDWAKTLEGAEYVQFSLSSQVSELSVETPEPCAVYQDVPEPPKNGDQMVPAPKGDNW